MNVIRNIQMDLNRFRSRVFVVTFVILIALGVLFLRLFYLQVIRYDELNAAAESNRTAIVPIVQVVRTEVAVYPLGLEEQFRQRVVKRLQRPP